MRRTKQAALLLASLLLLSTAVQAGNAAKAPPRSERIVAAAQDEDARKMPALPIKAEQAGEMEPTVWTMRTEKPDMPEASDWTAAENPSAPESLKQLPEQGAAPAAGADAPKAAFPEAEDWQLLLVNPWNEMPEDFEVTLKSLPDGHKVDERIYDALADMLQACRDEGLNPKICSSYRTMSKQTYLYNNKIARLRKAGYSKKAAAAEAARWVARPGTSEHQLGLALDIVSTSYQALTKKQERTAEQKWLIEHCWEYGFILRYPNDKSEITGIGYEPWHYRYVGVDVALDIRDSGLCLEEYLLAREEALAERQI